MTWPTLPVDQRLGITRMVQDNLTSHIVTCCSCHNFRKKCPGSRQNEDTIGAVFARTTAHRPNVLKARTGTTARVARIQTDFWILSRISYAPNRGMEVTESKEKGQHKSNDWMKSLTSTSVSQPTASLLTQDTPAQVSPLIAVVPIVERAGRHPNQGGS